MRPILLQAYFLTIPSKFAAATINDGTFEFWLGYSANFACHGKDPKHPYGECTTGSNAPDAGYSWVLQKMRLAVANHTARSEQAVFSVEHRILEPCTRTDC